MEIEPNFSGDKLTCRLTRYDGRRIYLDLSAPKDRERAESALRDFVSRAEQQLKLSMEEFTIRDSDIDQTQADLLMEIGRTPAPE